MKETMAPGKGRVSTIPLAQWPAAIQEVGTAHSGAGFRGAEVEARGFSVIPDLSAWSVGVPMGEGG